MDRLRKVLFAALLMSALASIVLLKTGAVTAAPLSSPSTCGKWSGVPSPNTSQYSNFFNGVAVISANDIWAVGNHDTGFDNITNTLTEHWNGQQWSVIPSPNASKTYNYLNGVAASSTSDVWAVGGYTTSTGGSFTLFEQWNGTKWNIVPSPSPNNYVNSLFKIAAVSANDIWAVGYQDFSTQSYQHSLIEHWDGTSWSVVPGATTINSIDTLYGVTAIASNDVWAVGQYNKSSNQNPMLIEHWNGTKWSVVNGPKSGATAFLASVARIPGTTSVWAVGDDTNNVGTEKTLTVYYC